jgi:AraC-like DNA-binding protein
MADHRALTRTRSRTNSPRCRFVYTQQHGGRPAAHALVFARHRGTAVPVCWRETYGGDVEVLHTESIEPRNRFAAWTDFVRSACGPLNIIRPRDDGFSGQMRLRQLHQIHAGVVTADPHTVVRSRQATGGGRGEYLYLCGLSAGEMGVAQDGRQAVTRAEELVCFDNTRVYTLAMRERFSMVTLMLPHRLVGLAPGATTALTAVAWSTNRGIAALLWPVIMGLGRHLAELDDQSAQQLESGIASLIGALFGERLRTNAGDPEAMRQALVLRIQAFARDHLSDPRLDPATLARRHNISLRYLQKLFHEQDLSPASWIRDERLASCRAELLDPRLAHLTVAAIGARSGLPGASHFSRLFRERYGVTPQEFRRRARPALESGTTTAVADAEPVDADPARARPAPLSLAELTDRLPEVVVRKASSAGCG